MQSSSQGVGFKTTPQSSDYFFRNKIINNNYVRIMRGAGGQVSSTVVIAIVVVFTTIHSDMPLRLHNCDR